MHRFTAPVVATGLFLLAGIAATGFSQGVNMSNLPDGLYAELKTSKGEIVLALEFEKTPLTVTNFVALAEGKMNTSSRKGQKFYDGLTFHRVIKDFMIQGGDPQGNGTGGPGYKFADEFDPSLKFSGPGILAMANSGPATNGSQFFITHKDTDWLNGKHTIFGHVVKGQEVVNAIAQGDKIETLTIVRKGAKAEAFHADQAAFDALAKKANAKLESAAADKAKSDVAAAAKLIPNGKKTTSGILYAIVKAGTGPKPKKGQTVKVNYTGKFLDGKVFDSSQGREPLELPIGVGNVIPAWDEAVLDMQVGEKRHIIAPPALAYGAQGYPGAIPPNSYLYFEIELISVK